MSAEIETQPSLRRLDRIKLLAILLLSLGILILVEFRTHNYITDLIVSALSGGVLAGFVHVVRPDRAKHHLNQLNATLQTSYQPSVAARAGVSSWITMAPVVTSALAVVGILIYAIVLSAYQTFYKPFGVDPSDLGYSYAKTISGAIGLIVLIITLVVPFSAAYLLVSCIVWSRTYNRIQPDHISWSEALRPLRMEFGLVLLLSFFCIAASYPILILGPQSRSAAAVARQGFSVRSRSIGPFVRLQLHADYAQIGQVSGNNNPTSKSDLGVAQVCGFDLRDLYDKSLLYLGQANGNIVLYDSECGRTVFIPQSSIVLQILVPG